MFRPDWWGLLGGEDVDAEAEDSQLQHDIYYGEISSMGEYLHSIDVHIINQLRIPALNIKIIGNNKIQRWNHQQIFEMEKGAKESFIEIPLTNFSRKSYQFPLSLFESRFVSNQKNQVEFRKILESRGYHVINLISTERIIFATKQAGSSWIGAVELKELPQSQKNLYLSLNVSLSLHKTIQPYFLMKNWRIENKIYLHDEKGNGVALVEYHFAQSDLRSFIQSQRLDRKKIELELLHSMFKMLIESIHNSHIENIYLNDIRPQTIFFQNNKWFIMKGELSQKIVFDYGSVLSKQIATKPPNLLYSSPLIHEGAKNDHVSSHNPFKSDVYALGLVLLELETIGILSASGFKELLENRKTILCENSSLSLDFREKMLIKGKQIFMIPNLLEMMLQQKQSERPYVFQISLLMNYTSLIMNRVLVPHQHFFKFQTVQSTTGRKKIVYPHVSIEYEGNFKEDTREKEGMGIVYYNGCKSFEGAWKNNLPTDKCSVYFSEYWKYQGMMKEGQFHDQGYLFFNGTRINEKKWCYNLSEDRVDITEKPTSFPTGYYFFLKSPQKDPKQYKVYFKKYNNTTKVFTLNTYLIDPKQIIFVINKILSPYTVSRVEILENQTKTLYNSSKYQLINLYTVDDKVIEILTGINHSRSLLIKLLESDILSKKNISLDLSGTGLIDEELRQLFDKPTRIEHLNISKCRIGDKGLRILSINEGTRYLKRLNLSYLDISDKALSQFAFSKMIQGLEQINISYCKSLSSEIIASFLCNQKFKRLRRIEIESTSFTHYGLQHLIKFNSFNKLEYLNIGLCHKINDAYFNNFLKNRIATSVTGLCLNSTILTDSILETMSSDECKISELQSMNLSGSINLSFYGLSKLFLSSKIRNLVKINLSGTYIDDQFLVLVAKSAQFSSKVKELYVSSCFAITDKGVLRLLKSQHFSQLEILDISKTFVSNDLLIGLVDLPSREYRKLMFNKCTKINDNGLQNLILSQNFRKVELLNISHTGVNSLTFNSLSESRHSNSLRELVLEECTKIDEKSIMNYFSSTNFKRLHRINLSKTNITNKILKSFETNCHNHSKFIEIDITDCKNLSAQGLECICYPNKLISTIQRKEENPNSIKYLSSSPFLLKMTKLELSTQEETDLSLLFSSQYCMNLTTISISDSFLKSCFGSMSTSKYLKNIKVLSVKSCEIDENQFRAFLKSENVMHLEELDISWTLLGNPTMYAISESEHLKYLEIIRIIKCININDKGMIKYLNSKVCQSLKVIDLRSTLLTNNTLECISKSTNIRQLISLSIRSCSNMKNLGIQYLLNSKNSHNLQYLDLSWNNFSGDIFKHLSNSKQLNQLKELEVSGLKNIENQLGDYLYSNNISSLKRLDLSSVTLKEDLIHILGSSESLQSINQLNLSNCNLSKQSVMSLLGSKNIEKIQKLNLASNWNQSDIVKYLLENEGRFQKLEALVLSSLKNVNLEQVHKVFKNLVIMNQTK